MSNTPSRPRLRSRAWFDDPQDPGSTALHVERYTNFGISAAELRSGKPIIGIAQTGSDLVPCNRIHVDLVHGNVPGPFDHHLRARRPAAVDQFPQHVQFGKLSVIAGVGDRAGT